MSYGFNILISIDQLGNTISGGNPDSTISARVGYFTQNPSQTKIYYYWKGLEKLINFSFYPLDGPEHCHQAYNKEGGVAYVNTGKDWMRFVLSFIIISTCIGIIIPLVYTITFLFNIKPKPDNIDDILIQSLEATNREIDNVFHLLAEQTKQGKSKIELTQNALKIAEEVKSKINNLVLMN